MFENLPGLHKALPTLGANVERVIRRGWMFHGSRVTLVLWHLVHIFCIPDCILSDLYHSTTLLNATSLDGVRLIQLRELRFDLNFFVALAGLGMMVGGTSGAVVDSTFHFPDWRIY
jgi:hypothetical protein